MLRFPALAAIAKLLAGVALAAGPNVIVVMPDDHVDGGLSVSGSTKLATPALGRFRGEPIRAPTRMHDRPGCESSPCVWLWYRDAGQVCD